MPHQAWTGSRGDSGTGFQTVGSEFLFIRTVLLECRLTFQLRGINKPFDGRRDLIGLPHPHRGPVVKQQRR